MIKWILFLSMNAGMLPISTNFILDHVKGSSLCLRTDTSTDNFNRIYYSGKNWYLRCHITGAGFNPHNFRCLKVEHLV